MTNFKPHASFQMPPPGALLAESIGALGLTKTEVAKRLGVTRKSLYDVLDGSSAITAMMALRLEATVGSSAEFWLNLQTQYDLWRARKALAIPARGKTGRSKARAA